MKVELDQLQKAQRVSGILNSTLKSEIELSLQNLAGKRTKQTKETAAVIDGPPNVESSSCCLVC